MFTSFEYGPADEAVALEIERRAYVRYPCNLESNCQSVAGAREDAWQGVVQNISVNGIGILLTRRFEPKTIISVEIPGTPQTPPRLMLARVIHVRAREAGRWYLGCAFLNKLCEEDLKILVARYGAEAECGE